MPKKTVTKRRTKSKRPYSKADKIISPVKNPPTIIIAMTDLDIDSIQLPREIAHYEVFTVTSGDQTNQPDEWLQTHSIDLEDGDTPVRVDEVETVRPGSEDLRAVAIYRENRNKPLVRYAVLYGRGAWKEFKCRRPTKLTTDAELIAQIKGEKMLDDDDQVVLLP